MAKLKAILYRGAEADLMLPIGILDAEWIHWEIEDDIPQMMILAKGKTNPRSGWLAWFPALNVGATTWTGLYQILDKRGLLQC